MATRRGVVKRVCMVSRWKRDGCETVVVVKASEQVVPRRIRAVTKFPMILAINDLVP